MSSVALIWLALPLRVRVDEPFTPAPMVAPPVRVTVRAPWLTLSRVVTRLLSTSATLMPVMASAVSSLTVCAPGTVLTGASLTLVTVTATFWLVKAPVTLVARTVTS